MVLQGKAYRTGGIRADNGMPSLYRIGSQLGRLSKEGGPSQREYHFHTGRPSYGAGTVDQFGAKKPGRPSKNCTSS